MMPEIDCVVNTWERSYHSVLQPGFFYSIEESNDREFNKILLINNVNNITEVMKLADKMVSRAEISTYYLVEEKLPMALEIAGLELADLGRLPHYSDAPFVAITLPGNDWVLYWDAEIELVNRYNWVDQSIQLISGNVDILVANPNWLPNTIRDEMLCEIDSFSLSYGFSDQCFLLKRQNIQQITWDNICPVSLRYPLAHISTLFEQRIDAYMRRSKKLRATFMHATYSHKNEGLSYPMATSSEKARRLIYNFMLKALHYAPFSSPCYKVTPRHSGFHR